MSNKKVPRKLIMIYAVIGWVVIAIDVICISGIEMLHNKMAMTLLTITILSLAVLLVYYSVDRPLFKQIQLTGQHPLKQDKTDAINKSGQKNYSGGEIRAKELFIAFHLPDAKVQFAR